MTTAADVPDEVIQKDVASKDFRLFMHLYADIDGSRDEKAQGSP